MRNGQAACGGAPALPFAAHERRCQLFRSLVHCCAVQLDLLRSWRSPRESELSVLPVGTEQVSFRFVRNPRARRYILRVQREGSVRVTIPRSGSVDFAIDFIKRNTAWLGRQLRRRREEKAQHSQPWSDGTLFLFRGEQTRLTVRDEGEIKLVQFADHTLCLSLQDSNIRQAVEAYLWSLAAKELVPLTLQAAAQHGVHVPRVVVRNQRSRWGSCSRRGTISLNWRLIQAPPLVRDYLIVHELMHRREMNHSPRFWSLVALACPEYAPAERWLDAHAHLLR